MIFTYLLSLVLGVAVYFIAEKLTMPARLGLSMGVFLMLTVAATIVLENVGDRAPADAITIDPKQLEQDKPNEQR